MSSPQPDGNGTAPEPKPGEWITPEEFAGVIRLTPLVAIDLIVKSPDGLVLIGRRINEPAKGLFFVPGSRISKNETLEAAFRRITKEELNQEVAFEQARFLGVYEHFYATNRFGKPGFGTHYIVLAHELGIEIDSKALPLDQHGEYRWLCPQDILSAGDVHPNTKAYFKEG